MPPAKRELADLLLALGLAFDPKIEELDEIKVQDTAVDPGKIKGALPQIHAAVTEYGSALEAQFRFEHPPAQPGDDLETQRRAGKPEWLPLDSRLTDTGIDTFLKKNAGGAPIVLDLTLRKRALIETFLKGKGIQLPAGIRPVLVLTPQALENLFSENLQEIERWWDAQQPAKLVILAPEWGHTLNGRYLAVVGGDPVSHWAQAAAVPSSPPQRIPEDVYKACRNNTWWQDEWLEHLTPLHLMVTGDVPADDPVAKALRTQLADLCLLFTADRSERRSGRPAGLEWIALYQGAGEKVEIEPVLASALTGEQTAGAAALADLVMWAYGEGLVSDRLSFLQNTVARALQGMPPAVGLGQFLQRAKSIFDHIGPDWKMFVDGKLSAFDSQIRALEDEVATTVQSFSAQIAAMIKSLSDTVLAALAVLLGAFIAGLIKEELKPEILAVSLTAYLLYLLAFPLIYNMTERRQSYRSLVQQFEDRRGRFGTRLSEEKVNTIVGTHVKKSQRRFRIWFRVVLATYLVIAAVLVALWLLIPSPIDSVAYQEEARKALKLDGPLAPNEELQAARLLGQRRLEGAEDVAVDAAGRLYTGTADGRIMSLDPLNEVDIKVYAETGGRPLGLHFGPAGKTLFVADANKGLLAIDEEGGVKVLATEAGRVPFAFTNDLDMAPDGTIYFSDASSRFGVNDYLYDLLEARPRGRLLVYTPPPPPPAEAGKQGKEAEEEGKVRVLLDGLSFANGVALAADGSFVLVAETYRYRIRRFWLTGSKAGTSEIFIDGLPGFPDNLSRDPVTGRFWVALYTVRNPSLDFLHSHPFLKDQLVKLPRFFWPKPKPYGLLIELDENGKILRSLHDPTGERVRGITSVESQGGKLYLGSLNGPIAVWQPH